jgi:DNA-binding phage protein
MARKTYGWDAVEALKTHEDIVAYLDAALDDGDPCRYCWRRTRDRRPLRGRGIVKSDANPMPRETVASEPQAGGLA